jgi:glyoxylase-like metal-dependent hydrolase (beta-lactamase superfamily II)
MIAGLAASLGLRGSTAKEQRSARPLHPFKQLHRFAQENLMIFRQLFEPETCTFTYLIGCERTHQAALIDPVAGEVDTYLAMLGALDLKLIFTLETHVHADHITASGTLRERLGSRSVVHKLGGAPCADVLVDHGDRIDVGDLVLEVRHTPGHTQGCVSYVMADRVFTGDSLFIGGCGRTDFQQGDAAQLYGSIHRQLFTLPSETLVFPGHDYQGNTQSTIGWEREHNPRLGGGKTREQFVEIMGGLNLAHPKYIDVALPANQSCGQV